MALSDIKFPEIPDGMRWKVTDAVLPGYGYVNLQRKNALGFWRNVSTCIFEFSGHTEYNIFIAAQVALKKYNGVLKKEKYIGVVSK